MATSVESAPIEEMYALLRASRWGEVREFFDAGLSSAEKASAAFRLPYAIATIRSGNVERGIAMIDGGILAMPNARGDLRRFVVPALIQEGKPELAVRILDQLIAADPESVDDLRLRASLLGRLKRLPAAIEDAATLVRLRPDDATAQTSYLQGLLQAGEIELAGAHAEAIVDRVDGHPRLSNMVLLSLTRSGRLDAAVALASDLAESDLSDELLAAAIVRSLFEAGRVRATIQTGERLLADGWEHPTLRSSVGQAYIASEEVDRYERAIQHLEVGLALEPNDPRMNSAIGEAMLRSRRYEDAIPYLERVCELQPKLAQARALYARALKQSGRYADAAVEFRKLLELQPSAPRWHRYAAGALSQAGHRNEAAKLFDTFVAERRRSLSKNFEKGLDALWQQVDSVEIPQARLDWAWSLSNSRPNDREEWERRAKWGHLADHYLLDWLECRDDRIHEAMTRLADLSEAERVLSEVDRSNGVILASAHIGPMYAGPLALELLGVQSRWLASTPSVARTAYAGSLISTSDQDDMQVARSFMLSVKQGYAVVIAVDGAINLAAPRIRFEGQEMTYSSFAARTAQRMAVPSLFCAPKWEGEKIGFVLERMPYPLEDEDPDQYADRWRDAFLAYLRNYLGGAPENLRLSGGLWRHIR